MVPLKVLAPIQNTLNVEIGPPAASRACAWRGPPRGTNPSPLQCTVLMHPQSYQTWADLHAIPDKERRPEFVRKAGAQMAGQYKSQASPDGILDNTTSLANYWSSKTNPLWPLKAPGRPRNNIA